MLTLKDVIPNNPKMAKEFLVKKEFAPKGKIREMYNAHCGSSLVRKIFTECLHIILIEVAMGKCTFTWPSKAQYKPYIFMGSYSDFTVKRKAKTGSLNYMKLFNCDYKVPRIQLKFSERSSRALLSIYVSKNIYNYAVDHANNGEHFSKVPRELDHYLPYIFDKFSNLKEEPLKRMLKFCFAEVMWHLRRGEEINFFSKSDYGFIRIHRNLGILHDKVMKKVKNFRIARNKNGKGRKIKYGKASS